MREVKKIERHEIAEWLRMRETSYPSMELCKESNFQNYEKYFNDAFEMPDRGFYALYEDSAMKGSMIIYDFTGNYYHHEISYKGVGMVAVDFLSKKKKVARDMMSWYLNNAKEQKADMAALHSFRPDFYKNMGFGFGTKVHHYSITPHQIKAFQVQGEYVKIDQSHSNELTEFFNALYLKQHGMMRKHEKEIKNLLKASAIYVTGFRHNGQLCGLAVYTFQFDHINHQKTDLEVNLMALNDSGLKGLLNFFKSQSDQIRNIKIQSQNELLYYMLDDPRHSDLEIIQMPAYHLISNMGLGMLYKSLNHKKLIALHPVMKDHIKIRFEIRDSFSEQECESFTAEWHDKEVTFTDSTDYDVRIAINVAEFSSWIMNAIDLNSLFEMGLADICPAEKAVSVSNMFSWHQKPVCDTRF